MISRNKLTNNDEGYLKKPSTVIGLGDVLTFDPTGTLIPAVAGSTQLVGLSQREVKVSDADYASTTPITVDEFTALDRFEIDTVGAVVAQSMVGKSYDLSDAKTLNVAVVGTQNHFKIVAIMGTLTGSKVVVKPNPARIF